MPDRNQEIERMLREYVLLSRIRWQRDIIPLDELCILQDAERALGEPETGGTDGA